jgi:hypothetical protein
MAGYNNYSMSNNAVAAYEEGKMPLSKWTKTAILEAVEMYLGSIGNESYFQKFENMTKMELMRLIESTREWHHTSKHFNKTWFYQLNESLIDFICQEGQTEDYILFYQDSCGYVSETLNEQKRYFTTDKNKAKKVTEYAANKFIKNSVEFNVNVEKVRI